VLRAENLWCHVALQEREVRAVEKLRRLNLISQSPRLSLQIVYLRVSSNILKSLLKTEARLKTLTR